jgi:glycine betaine/choline ABC-type transport system substrate-binding protein
MISKPCNYPLVLSKMDYRRALGTLRLLLLSLIDNATMSILNYEVNGNKRGISELVTEFLQDKEIL